MSESRVIPTGAKGHIGFRLITLLFAIVLGAQSFWLVLAQILQPGINRLPIDATAAAAAADRRGAAATAAWLGAIRGDLWAQSAFSYADLLFDKTAASVDADVTKSSALARKSLGHALMNAPHQSGAWLFLAGLSLRDSSSSAAAVTEFLKMSYYTGPSEEHLIPVRLRMALQSDSFNDVEMRQFIVRDLRVLLARQQRATIAQVYSAASPAGRHFVEQTVRDVDPSMLNSLTTDAHRHSLPD